MNAPVEKSLLRWLGLRQDSSVAISASVPTDAIVGPAEFQTVEDIVRQKLLLEITTFLLEHKLAVTDGNLHAARAAFSGTNRALQRKISGKRLEKTAITQAWLDEAIGAEADVAASKQEYGQLLTRLQNALEAFTTTTKSARSAHGDYRTSLESHVGSIVKDDVTGLAISSLTDIARAMLERTRLVENDMRRCEKEALGLRKSLDRAQRDAQIDHLTGLPNRRAFEGVLEREYREAQSAIEPLHVAFCDIDYFKRINDLHGHETGDRVIQAIAQVLARISNEKCHVSRHGGEEFVILFRDMSGGNAKARLDEAREQLANRHFMNRNTDQPIGGITFSAGIADVFAYPDCRAALEAADAALYRAKQEGRNRILLA